MNWLRDEITKTIKKAQAEIDRTHYVKPIDQYTPEERARFTSWRVKLKNPAGPLAMTIQALDRQHADAQAKFMASLAAGITTWTVEPLVGEDPGVDVEFNVPPEWVTKE